MFAVTTDLALHLLIFQTTFQHLSQVVKALVQNGAQVNSEDNDRRTAVQSASWQGHEDVVRILLEAGASADHTCNQGATALCIAAQEGHEDVVRTLLAFRANPNHADQFGRTPYRVALKSGHQRVCKILEDFGAVVPTGVKSRSNSSSASSGVGVVGINGGGGGGENKIGNIPSSPTNVASSNRCGKETESPSRKDGKGRERIHSSGDCMSEVRAVNSGVREVRRASDTAAQPSSTTAVATATSTIMALTGSPELPSERRKSYHSYNSKSSSTKSSSNMTSSTNQSGGGGGGGGGNMSRLDRECLTFTQQLQQCSMGKNRSRPISRVLSPVSEPQSPVAVRSPSSSQPPPLPSHPPPPALTSSPAARLGPGADSTEGYCEIHTGLGVQIISSSRKTTVGPSVSSENALSPPPPPLPPKGPGLSLNRTHAVLAPSKSTPAGSSSVQVKPERRVSATINIITNPHADMMSSVEEPVWQRNPAHPASSSSVSTTSSSNVQPSNGSYVQNYHNHFIHHNQQQQTQHEQQFQPRQNGSSSGNANHNNFLTVCSSSSSSSGSHLDGNSHHHHHQHHPHGSHHHHPQQQQALSSTGSSPSRIIMGQSSLANKSPERRWKRNGIVTNPKAMHTSSTPSTNGNNYARSMSNSSNSSNSNSISQQFHRFSGGAAPNTSTTLISPTSPTSNGHARRASFSPTTSPTNGFEPQSPRRASDVNPRTTRHGKGTDHVQASCGQGSPLVGQPALYQLDYGQQAGVKPVRPNGLPIKKVNSPRSVPTSVFRDRI